MSHAATEAARLGLKQLLARLDAAAEKTLEGAMAAAVAEAKATRTFEDRTGKTRASIRAEPGFLRGVVRAGHAARYLEWGTRPHLIRARNGQALRFMVNGQVLFRRQVNHPGTKPRPFMRTARDVAWVEAHYLARAYVAKAVEGQ